MITKRRLIADTEADGLLPEVTQRYLFLAKDRDTKETFYWEPGDNRYQEFLMEEVESVTGHNWIGYDIPMLEKVDGFIWPQHIRIQDSLLFSQILNYWRFGPHGGHSMEAWGEHLKFNKGEFSDFSKYTPEMLEYGLRDLELNDLIAEVVMKEFSQLYARNPNILAFLQAEHAAAMFQSEAQLKGWPFNINDAMLLRNRMEQDTEEAVQALESNLGYKLVYTDIVRDQVPEKTPKWTKAGIYDYHTRKALNLHEFAGLPGDRVANGPYSRVSIEPLRLGSTDDVKVFLFRNNWVPTEYNMKADPTTGRKVKTSPKITDDSLELLGGDGALYTKFRSASSRLGVLRNWISGFKNGRIHGDSLHVGTPSMRVRHAGIVNIPGSEALYGKEVRSLFTVPEGWVMVGADSSGNQARGLAFYLNDAEFTHQLLEGDIHQYNADILTTIMRRLLQNPEFVVPRSAAKRILYAFLFGASGAKLWGYIMGTQDHKLGSVLKKEFTKAVPGFEALIRRLESEWEQNRRMYGYGYITGIAGNRIYVDSKHKLLVYLLQACEKATCSSAVRMIVEGLNEAGIPWQPLIYYHDECDFMVKEGYEEAAQAIAKAAFKEAPKQYGITIMDGEAKIGKDWYECH